MRITQTGFSRFEWGLAIVVVGILSAVFLGRIIDFLLEVEQVRIQRWESRFDYALSHELSSLLVARKYDQISQLDGTNPVNLLENPPASYLGEQPRPNLADLPAGSWVFDTEKRSLIYLVRHRGRFISGLEGRPRIEYRVFLDFQDNNQSGRFEFKQDTLNALQLISVGAYRWSDQND